MGIGSPIPRRSSSDIIPIFDSIHYTPLMDNPIDNAVIDSIYKPKLLHIYTQRPLTMSTSTPTTPHLTTAPSPTNSPSTNNHSHNHNTSNRTWYHHLTLDTLLLVLCRTILHPWFAWMTVLSLRAQATPYTDLPFILTTAYATLLTLLAIASAINHRIAYGNARPVDLSEEVVVVTGGGSGLGLLIARIYGLRGVSVAVLDVKEIGEVEGWEEGSGVEYYQCDIGSRRSVEWAMGRIRKDVCFLSTFWIWRSWKWSMFFLLWTSVDTIYSWARRLCWSIVLQHGLTASRSCPYQQTPSKRPSAPTCSPFSIHARCC